MEAWKDVTSYSQGDKERIARSWEYRAGKFRITVTRLHGADGWYLTVNGLCSQVPINETEIDKAKQVALSSFREVLTAAFKGLPE